MTHHAIAHGNFSIDRIFDATPWGVFDAWSNIELKQRWFIGPEGWAPIRRDLNLETGGRETLHGRLANGRMTYYDAYFYDVVANRRIVYAYDMHIDDSHHSVSLSTVEIEAVESRTRLIYHEQTAWLDGTSTASGVDARRRGVGWHLDNLAKALRGDR